MKFPRLMSIFIDFEDIIKINCDKTFILPISVLYNAYILRTLNENIKFIFYCFMVTYPSFQRCFRFSI